MTKQELKELISETVKEQLATESTSVISEDAPVADDFAQAIAVKEACIEVIGEGKVLDGLKGIVDGIKEGPIMKLYDSVYQDAIEDGKSDAAAAKLAQKAIDEKFGKKVVEKLNAASGENKPVFSILNGKIQGKAAYTAVGVAATAAIAAGVAGGVALVKKKKKAKEEKAKETK